MKSPTLRTKRLLLRRWTLSDCDIFAQINADPEVMRYRFRPLARHESDDLIEQIEASFDQYGFGQWAVERTEDERVIGFIGLDVAEDDALFAPPFHIGWHLARDAWGCGYATEGAAAVLEYVFDVIGLPEVVAHTTSANARSQAVMRRLGMRHNTNDDFDAPWYPEGHPHRRFVLYRTTANDWQTRPAEA
jgi:ribosomal-protein-alanine N-acetyltransferase